MNNLQNIGTVAFCAHLEAAGLDPKDVDLVEMPHPDMSAALERAITASGEQLQGDHERLVQLVPTYSKVTAEVTEQVEMPMFQVELDLERLQRTADLMQQYGITGGELEVSDLVAEPVR